MLEVAQADIELGFVHPQACRKSRVDANDRAFRGFPMAARVASHAPECTELTVEGDRGFESVSSTGESGCEPDYFDQEAVS
jgi:hypothetical protein